MGLSDWLLISSIACLAVGLCVGVTRLIMRRLVFQRAIGLLLILSGYLIGALGVFNGDGRGTLWTGLAIAFIGAMQLKRHGGFFGHDRNMIE